MVNKALRIVLYTIFTISLLFVVPFNNIHADTISTSNITYNYYLTDVVDSTSQLANKNYIYDVDFVFDKSYLGWVSVSMVTSYIFATGDTRQATYTKAIYVNGNSAKTSIVISSNYTGVNGSPLSSMSITINNSNVTPLADLSSLQDIIDLLQDIDNHISIDVITELQDIVANTSLSNDYLNIISQLRQWNIPIESVSFVTNLLMYRNPIDYYDYGYYSRYPLFFINRDISNVGRFTTDKTKTYTFVLICRSYSLARFNNCYEFDTSYTISNFEVLNQFYYEYNNQQVILNLIKFNVNFANNVNTYFNWKVISSDYDLLIPIYFGFNNNISTDFALQYGLTNSYLDNIQIIANGTNASSAASSQSDQANSQLQQDSNTLFTQEDTFKQDMNSAMQNIDTTFSLNNFGSSFMTSAQWVRTQYETLTNNTPFASLITFSLLVGLALIVIGKVYK